MTQPMTSPGEEMMARLKTDRDRLVEVVAFAVECEQWEADQYEAVPDDFVGQEFSVQTYWAHRARIARYVREKIEAIAGLSALREGGGGEDGSSVAGLPSPQVGSDPIGGAPLDGWQPIDTAPRDGTNVLLWAPHWSHPITGWTFGEDSWQDCRKDAHERPPTHWQSLPAPPAAAASGFAGSDTTEQSDLAREASGNQSSKGPAANDKLSDGEG